MCALAGAEVLPEDREVKVKETFLQTFYSLSVIRKFSFLHSEIRDEASTVLMGSCLEDMEAHYSGNFSYRRCAISVRPGTITQKVYGAQYVPRTLSRGSSKRSGKTPECKVTRRESSRAS